MIVFIQTRELPTVQTVVVVGVSAKSWRDAVCQAVASVLNPTRRMVGLEVTRSESWHTDGNTVFRVLVAIAYTARVRRANRIRRRLARVTG